MFTRLAGHTGFRMANTPADDILPRVDQHREKRKGAQTMAQARLLLALDLLRQGNLRKGEAFETAHEICQENEGSAMFDWVHALVHRIEGDDANAAYWYDGTSGNWITSNY